MSRQRPSWDHAPPIPASRTEVPPAPLIQGSWRAGHNRNGRRHPSLLAGTSLALHLTLGLLAALAVRPAVSVQEAAPPVEVVFETGPLPPALSPASATASERPAEPPKTAPLDAPAETAQPPPAEPAAPQSAEPATPPPSQAPLQAPPLAEAPPSPAEPSLPAPISMPDQPLPGPAEPSVLERRTPPAPPPAPPPVPPARPPKPIASRRQAPPRPAPATAQQPAVPVMPIAPRSAATAPEAVAGPSRAQPLAALPASPAPAAGASPAAVNGAWRGALAAWVQSRKRYPDEARRQGAEGQVAVRFTVGRDGQVLDAQVVRGSGSDLLDQAALSMFRGGRAPPFPTDMAQAQVTTTVSIRYHLQE